MDKNFHAKIIDDSPIGFAYHQVIYDQNDKPIDYNFIDVNKAFEKQSGMTKETVLGKKATAIFTGHAKRLGKWIALYGRIGLSGQAEEFEEFSPELGRWFKVHLSSPQKGYVVSQIINVSEQMDKLTELEQLKNKLEESEKRYQMVSEYSFDWEAWEGADGKMLYVSPACEDICGYPREIFYQQKNFLHHIIIEEDKTIWKNHQHYGIHPSGVNRETFRIRHKDGHLVWIQHSCRSVYGPEGDHLGFRSNNRDITEMKEAQDKILEEQAQFQKIIENFPFCLTIISLDGTVLYVNESALQLFGMPKDVIGTKSTFLAWQDPAQRKFWLEELREKGMVKDFEMRVKSASGKCFWTMASGIIINYKGQRAVLSTQHDITERKVMEEALKESEQKYKNLFENAVETILVFQGQEIMIANPAATELSGYSQEELRRVPFNSLFHPDDLEKVYQIHKRRLGDPCHQERYQVRIIRKNGQIRWVESDGIKIDWEGRDAILNFVVDITDRKLTEDALKRSEEKYRFLTEFASDVIWILNLDKDQYTYISPAIMQLRGLSVEQALKEKPKDSLTAESFAMITKVLLEKTIEFKENPQKRTYYIYELQQPHQDGSLIWVEVSAKFRYNANGEIEIIGVSRNIEERKKAEQDILFLSYRDQLTKLYNRRYYEETVEKMNGQLPLTLVMADVNGLKMTNDAFGHLVGDKLLKGFAEILKETSRRDDFVARIGGDEFVVLLPNTSSQAAKEIVKRIQLKVKETKIENILMSVSLGYATKTEACESIEKIFSEAEDMMYRKKLLEGRSMKNKMIQMIVKSLHEKSSFEKEHCERVALLCRGIGQAIGFSADEVDDLGLLGLVHDIGKIAISKDILNKTSDLNDLEWLEMRKHPEIGYQILRSVSEFAHVSDYVLCHHERLDGSGYPRNIKNQEIPIESKILAVAEAYDRMTNKWSHRPVMSEKEALKELRRCSGTQFDPEIVKIFIKNKRLMDECDLNSQAFIQKKQGIK